MREPPLPLHEPPLPASDHDWSLFLDVDGTLIELAETPDAVRMSAALKELLAKLSRRFGGAVALVSGRSIARLDQLFAPLHLPCAGLHGVERRDSSGVLHGPKSGAADLATARATLGDLVAAHPGTLLEDKGRTLAVHYRRAPQFQTIVEGCVHDIAAALGEAYHVQGGSMMLEIKPRGFGKGSAIRGFMQEPPFAGRIPVFLGDDLTDLDGFNAVQALGGISIAVGDRVQAGFRLDDPTAVHRWLERIIGADGRQGRT